jgi:hypothetical protein
MDNIHLVWYSEPGSQNKLCSGTCKARPELARFAQDEKKVSVTERPSLGQAALEFIFKNRPQVLQGWSPPALEYFYLPPKPRRDSIPRPISSNFRSLHDGT